MHYCEGNMLNTVNWNERLSIPIKQLTLFNQYIISFFISENCRILSLRIYFFRQIKISNTFRFWCISSSKPILINIMPILHSFLLIKERLLSLCVTVCFFAMANEIYRKYRSTNFVLDNVRQVSMHKMYLELRLISFFFFL